MSDTPKKTSSTRAAKAGNGAKKSGAAKKAVAGKKIDLATMSPDEIAKLAPGNAKQAEALTKLKEGLEAARQVAADAQAEAAAQEAQSLEATGGQQLTVSQALGEIVWLMSQSPEHKHYSIADLEWLVMPPIILKQFRIFYAGDAKSANRMPVGVALWAWASPETHEKLESGNKRLRPEEWNCFGKLQAVMKGDAAGDQWSDELPGPASNPPEMYSGDHESAKKTLYDVIAPNTLIRSRIMEVVSE